MSDSRVYVFHQQEVDNLKSAAIYTLAVCDNLKRMLEGIRDDQPRQAARAISELLDPNYQCKSNVDKVDHLIAPVNVPVNVPRRTKMHHGPDGIHYEKKFPLTIELREESMAHRAAWALHDTVVTYLWSVWRRVNPTLVCCDAIKAADELVRLRWQEIREELKTFVDYDCNGLRKAVEAESNAAMAQCRQTIVGDAASIHKPNIDAGGYVPTPSSTAAERGKEAIDKQDGADSEHSAGDDKQDSTRKKPQIRLANWAIAVEDGKTFRLFHRRGKEADWRDSGKVDVRAGLQRAVLLVLADNDGALTKDEAIKAVQENRKGMSNSQIMKSVVTPTLTKLRSTIKAAIARVAKTTLESGEIGDPLPYCKSSQSWRSDISIGFAELNDDGDRLRLVTKSQQDC
jgi:hypothetical protein